MDKVSLILQAINPRRDNQRFIKFVKVGVDGTQTLERKEPVSGIPFPDDLTIVLMSTGKRLASCEDEVDMRRETVG